MQEAHIDVQATREGELTAGSSAYGDDIPEPSQTDLNGNVQEPGRKKGLLERYAELGFHLFPQHSVDEEGICSCRLGAECTSPGKHPSTLRGFKDATNDVGELHAMFRSSTDPNVGLACGPSGLVVLDVDPRSGGRETWDQLLEEYSEVLVDTVMAITGGDGFHVYFRHPKGVKLVDGTGKLGRGVDVKTKSSVTVPPSRHASGKRYRWQPGASPFDREIAELPAALVQRLSIPEARPSPAVPSASFSNVTSTVGTADRDVIPEGRRNTTLTSIAGMLRARGLTEDEITAALLVANDGRCLPPLPEAEVRTIARSIGQRPVSNTPVIRNDSVETNLTDAANSERFAHRWAGRVKYCPSLGGWLIWDGLRWTRDSGNTVMQKAIETARSILVEAAETADRTDQVKLIDWAKTSQSLNRLNAMLTLASSADGIRVVPERFDGDPFKLTCLNGTIDLKTGELYPHNPADLITRLAHVEYHPDAEHDLWAGFLKTVTDHDQEIEDFLQVAAGYSLTGDTGEEKLFFVHGPTRTGKSTFMDAIKAALGDYAMTTNFETFLARKSTGSPRDDIAELVGARLVTSIEVDKGQQLAEALVKSLTGGDKVRARLLYKDSFEYLPQFKLWLVANDPPRVGDDDDAIWQRILEVPFAHQIPAGERDPRLKARLRDPADAGPAVLAWMVKGCLRWQQEGLRVPRAVVEATQAYRRSMDPLQPFISEMCILDAGANTAAVQLYEVYTQWARASKRPAVSKIAFGRRLAALGCPTDLRRIHGVPARVHRGIGLAEIDVPVTDVTDNQHDEGNLLLSSLTLETF
jgi:putative DNA primase/helicase